MQAVLNGCLFVSSELACRLEPVKEKVSWKFCISLPSSVFMVTCTVRESEREKAQELLWRQQLKKGA